MTRPHAVDTDPKLPHRAAAAGEKCCQANGGAARAGFSRERASQVERSAPTGASAAAVGFRGKLMEMRRSRARR
jgi:hypothetical protein